MTEEILNTNDNDIKVISSSQNTLTNSSNTNSRSISPQDDMEKTCGCRKESQQMMNSNNPSFVYAIGKVWYRFPNMSIENELWQTSGRKADQRKDDEKKADQRKDDDLKGITEPEAISKILKDPNNRYLLKDICWTLKIEGLDTYILVPRDPMDIDSFSNALYAPDRDDINVIIGTRGPIATPDMCNGLVLPILIVDQLYSFNKDEILKAIPKGTTKNQFYETADDLFEHVIQIADNVGATDEHRAINYLSVRYDQIYNRTQLMQDQNYLLNGIEVQPSRLSNIPGRKILDVIFSYEERRSAATEKWFTRVDVTGKFPFRVSPLQRYYER